MLPRETSVRQLKKLRAETKGKDIGDLTVNDRLNKNLPNIQYIGNPIDTGEIESWEEFSKKDSQLQTIAFKSKLVNKPLVKGEKTNEIWGTFATQNYLRSHPSDGVDNKDEQCRKCDGHYRKNQMTKVNGKVTCDKCGDQVGRHDEIEESITEKTNENMKDKVNNLLKFDDFEKNWNEEEAKPTKRTEVAKDVIKEEFYNTDELDDDDLLKQQKKREYDYNLKNPGHEHEREDYLDDEAEDDFVQEDDNIISKFDFDHDFTEDELDELEDEINYRFSDDDDDDDDDDLDEFESVKTFDKFYITEKKDKCCKDCGKSCKDCKCKECKCEKPVKESKEEKQPEYTMLGKEKEPKSNPNFGIGAVKDQEIKKIAFFNNFPIDPKTPKERPVLNAGQFIHTEKVRGYVNRVEGTKVFVESLDEPMKIIEISLKDAVKKPVEPQETIKNFNEIVDELNKEFLKNK